MIEEYLKYTCFACRTFGFDKSFVFEDAEVLSGSADEDMEEDAEQPPTDEKAAEEAIEKGNLMIDAGFRIPTITTEQWEGITREREIFGTKVDFHYVVTDPTKPYVAAMVPLSFVYEGTDTSNPEGETISRLSDTFTFSVGLGVEGGIPIAGVVTPYIGLGTEGGIQFEDYLSVTSASKVSTGLLSEGVFSPYAVAGVRVNPFTNAYLYADVKPSFTFVGNVDDGYDYFRMPVHVGAGFGF